jgi:TIR domain
MEHRRTQVFISYSRRDAQWLERLQVHLRPLVRESTIKVWDDTQIKPGAIWAADIQSALEKAKVAVLLISADFMASDFIASKELPPLLHAAEEDGAIIMPVIVSASIFSRTERLSRFQAVNDPSRPLVDMTPGEREAVFAKIAEQVDLAIGRQELRAKLESVQERQGRQSEEIEWIRLLVDLVVSDYERKHLRILVSDGPFWADVQRNSTFEWELRHLLTLGLVDRHPGRGIRSLFRDEGRRDVKEHLFITERGKKYLQLLSQVQSSSHV